MYYGEEALKEIERGRRALVLENGTFGLVYLQCLCVCVLWSVLHRFVTHTLPIHKTYL